MSRLKKATIYDIAEVASTSASTVAAVMNGSWKKRRVAEKTAKLIKQIARDKGYEVNLQARGLRKSKSGLIGMIVPMLDNRFFSSLAQEFEAEARKSGSFPVVVSTLREPRNEQATARALIAHNIDAMFIAGATDPDKVSEICAQAGVRNVTIDLPGKHTTSVISDNFAGARDLTMAMIDALPPREQPAGFYFIGGRVSDQNTAMRIKGFKAALKETRIKLSPKAIHATSYDASEAERTIARLYGELGRLPDGLFVNSTISFEGVARFLTQLPIEQVKRCRIGCFDYDPFVEMLEFPVLMARQNTKEMIREGYLLLQNMPEAPKVIHIRTDLIIPKPSF